MEALFNGLVAGALRHRMLVLVMAALLLAAGGWSAASLPIDVLPDVNRPTVTLLTEAGGRSPEEVEAAITRPIEAAMAGATGVERVRSQSAAGLAVVQVEFGWSTDPQRARQQVAERLGAVTLPDGVTPEIGPLSSVMGEILLIGLVSPGGGTSPAALRSFADRTLAPVLQSTPGVSQVTTMGGGVEQLQVELHPDRLAARGLSLDAVREAAADAAGGGSGGFLDRDGQEAVVRTLARSVDPAELGDTVVAVRNGVPIRLSDVADVGRGVGPMRGDAGVNGAPGVILSVQKQPGVDSVALTGAVEAALAGVARPADVEVVTLFRQADFIGAAVGHVEDALRDGAIGVAVVLGLFLLSARTTAISLVAIPLSVALAALGLHGLGLGVNTMTLGGLAIAVGELVDDSVVDVENVLRRLRENAALPVPRPAWLVIRDASVEVRGAVVQSTALVALVFVPLLAMTGVEGRLFAPLGLAYMLAIVASLAVSLTVTPALCALLLPAEARADHRDGRLVRGVKRLGARVVSAALPRPGAVLAGTAVVVLLAAGSLPWMGTRFLPDFHEGSLTVNLLAEPGISLSESARVGAMAEAELLGVPEVLSTGRRTGRAEGDEHAEGVHHSEIDVALRPGGRPQPEVLADIRARLARVPGVRVSLGQPIGHRLDHLLSGVRAPIAVKLFGPDLAVLRAQAGAIAARLSGVPGLVDLAVEPQVLVPELRVDVDRAAAARFGVAPARVAADAALAIGGERVAQLFDGPRPLDLVVRYAPPFRADPDAIAAAPLTLPDGRAVRLDQLAQVSEGTTPNEVLHEGGQRRIALRADAAGRDIGSVVADVRAAVAGAALPPGYRVEVGGESSSQQAASRTLAGLAALALVGMYLVLYAHFGAHTLVWQVLYNIPLALVGAVAAVWASGEPLSVATLVGFITLCGIASRNSVLMISHYLHLSVHEGVPFGPELVLRGSQERLVPVAMTALCAGVGLVPLVIARGQPGTEILAPVAEVILGGLCTSTLLDVVVTPALFLRFGRAAVARAHLPPGDP